MLTSPTWPSTTYGWHTGSPRLPAGVWLTGADERISTAQELVAAAVPALVRLPTSVLLADAAPEPVAGEASWRSGRPGRCACLTERSPFTAATTAT